MNQTIGSEGGYEGFTISIHKQSWHDPAHNSVSWLGSLSGFQLIFSSPGLCLSTAKVRSMSQRISIFSPGLFFLVSHSHLRILTQCANTASRSAPSGISEREMAMGSSMGSSILCPYKIFAGDFNSIEKPSGKWSSSWGMLVLLMRPQDNET